MSPNEYNPYVSRLEKWILENYKVGDIITVDDVLRDYYLKDAIEKYENAPRENKLRCGNRLSRIRNKNNTYYNDKIAYTFTQMFMKKLASKIYRDGTILTYDEMEQRYIKSWDEKIELMKSPTWFARHPDDYKNPYKGEMLVINDSVFNYYLKQGPLAFKGHYHKGDLFYCGSELCNSMFAHKIQLISKEQPTLVEKEVVVDSEETKKKMPHVAPINFIIVDVVEGKQVIDKHKPQKRKSIELVPLSESLGGDY